MKYLFYPVQQLLCLSTLLHFSANEPIVTKECLLKYDIKPVTFSSLVKYQASHSSFSPSHATYQGNIVDFNFDSIDKLPTNSFVSFGSNSIIKLILNHKRIKEIDAGAFQQLFCLHYLLLKQNMISNLTEDAFVGLRNLQHLDLSENLFENISGLLFHRLSNLRELNLSKNRIRSVDSLAFFNLTRLEVLDLSFNKIQNLLPSVFSSLHNLRELHLNENYLGDIEPEKWSDLDNLEVLNLANNRLNKFDPSYNFSFAGLKKLNLSGNSLTSLNVVSLRKNLMKLNTIDISENNWLCKDLLFIKYELLDSQIGHLTGVKCNMSGEYKHATTENSVPSTTTALVVLTKVTDESRDHPNDTLVHYKEMVFSQQKLIEKIQRNQKIFIWLFLVVITLIFIDVAVRHGVFQYMYLWVTGRDIGRNRDEHEHMLLRSYNY